MSRILSNLRTAGLLLLLPFAAVAAMWPARPRRSRVAWPFYRRPKPGLFLEETRPRMAAPPAPRVTFIGDASGFAAATAAATEQLDELQRANPAVGGTVHPNVLACEPDQPEWRRLELPQIVSRGEILRLVGEQSGMVGPYAIEFFGRERRDMLVRVDSGADVGRWGAFFECGPVKGRDHGPVHVREAFNRNWRGYQVTVSHTRVHTDVLNGASA